MLIFVLGSCSILLSARAHFCSRLVLIFARQPPLVPIFALQPLLVRATYRATVQKKYLEVKKGILYRQWEDAGGGGVNKCLQLVIPPSTVPSVLSELHDSLSGGHLGVGKVLEKVRARFYWVGQRHDMEEWCGSCNLCGSTKAPPKQRHASLQIHTNPLQICTNLLQIRTATAPMDRVAMDILGPLPITPRQY